MHRGELLGPLALVWSGVAGGGGRARLRWRIERFVPEGAPHPLERAGVRIEHDHATVAVSVGHENLVRVLIHERLRWSPYVLRICVAAALAAAADL